jgi:hypothetical protein
MKASIVNVMIGLVMFGMAAPVFANGHGGGNHGGGNHGAGGVEKRIQRQKKRIEKGVENGKLTADQAKALEANVDKIQAEKAAMSGDGTKLTQEERTQLQHELKDSSKAIHDAKHPKTPAQPAVPAVPAVPASGSSN